MNQRCKHHWIGLPTPTCCLSRALPPEAKYRFKHALIQDAAYESLLKSRRQALHRRAAEVLREARACRRAGSDRPSFHPGWARRSRDRMVGQGGRPGAAPLGLPGGDRPSRQGDRDGGQGGRGSARAVGDEATSHQRMKLHSDYSQAMMWSKGFAAEETKAALARAADLAAKSDDFSERFAAAYGQWTWRCCGANCDRRANRLRRSCGKRRPRGASRRPASRAAASLSSATISAISRRREHIVNGRSTLATPTMKTRRGNATASTRGPTRPPSSPPRIGSWARSSARASSSTLRTGARPSAGIPRRWPFHSSSSANSKSCAATLRRR